MKPLAEMPRTPPPRIYFDVDDTVTNQGKLELVAFEAMHKAQEQGIELVAVTGRSLGYAEAIAAHWPVKFAIGENGAGWVRIDSEGTDRGFFEEQESLVKNDRRRTALLAALRDALPELPTASDHWLRRRDLAFDIDEHYKATEEEIECAKEIGNEHGFIFSRSSIHMHFAAASWTKLRGIRKANSDQKTETNLNDSVYIGDSANDAACFGAFARSVGVANLLAHVQLFENAGYALPKFVATKKRGRGFAEVVSHVGS